MSSIRSGSPNWTSPLDSASMSQSNGSTAPILPNFASFAPETPPRNKLVKRSSSQRVLNRDSKHQSALKRPATSHQRSATLQRQNGDGNELMYRGFHSSPLPYDLPENQNSFDAASQRWRPFFKPQYFRDGKVRSSGKHSLQGITAKHDALLPIVPDLTELPTLLLATSISTQSSDEYTAARPSNLSRLSRPFTPAGLSSLENPSPQSQPLEASSKFGDRPTTSFSLSDIFPSPSPMTWKMPRAGSVRGKKFPGKPGRDRRVASAPQPSKSRIFTTPERNDNALGNHIHIYASPDQNGSPITSQSMHNNDSQRPPTSPLPPLNRLSSFRIELPESIPSYPASPQPNVLHGRAQDFFKSSSSPTSPSNQLLHMSGARLPSGTHSEYGSTLLESDNDNSRILSGDDDDLDTRSSTFYDSTKTGATSISLSGTKRPHIETIFDEPPPVLPEEDKLLALENLRINDSKFSLQKRKAQSMVPQFDVAEAAESTALCQDQGTANLVLENNLPSGSKMQTQSSTMKQRGNTLAHGPEHKLIAGEAMCFPYFNNANNIDEAEKSSMEATYTLREIPTEGRSTSQRSTPRRRESSSADSAKLNLFEWSEQTPIDRDSTQTDLGRPRTVHGRQSRDSRGSRLSGRRGPPPLHLRSQSVPVPNDNRNHSNGSKGHGWILGNKSASEDWDGDFDFEEPVRTPKQVGEGMRSNLSTGMLVPKAILERQASVHGQFGHVKELTKLVEELKRLQQQAKIQGILNGQAIELWKEAEGIINLATLDEEEQDFFPASSPTADFDFFDDDSPSSRRRRSEVSPSGTDESVSIHNISPGLSTRLSHEVTAPETTPPSHYRPWKQSSAKARVVLESIYQQRTHYNPTSFDNKMVQKKLPFDTTSLKDLVIRAGVVTRALKEEIRRAETRAQSPEPKPDQHRPKTPPDPPFSQMFQKPSPPPSFNRSPRITQSPKSQKSSHSSLLGGSITGNDNEINGHMKIMTVV